MKKDKPGCCWILHADCMMYYSALTICCWNNHACLHHCPASCVNCTLACTANQRIKFGQLLMLNPHANSTVVAHLLLQQVIKNQPAYYHQARVEVGILQLLNGRCDAGDEHHIVRLFDAFLHKRHLCLVFEQLGINLFELLKRNGFRGLSLNLLRLFLQQVSTQRCLRCLCQGCSTYAVVSRLRLLPIVQIVCWHLPCHWHTAHR